MFITVNTRKFWVDTTNDKLTICLMDLVHNIELVLVAQEEIPPAIILLELLNDLSHISYKTLLEKAVRIMP